MAKLQRKYNTLEKERSLLVDAQKQVRGDKAQDLCDDISLVSRKLKQVEEEMRRKNSTRRINSKKEKSSKKFASRKSGGDMDTPSSNNSKNQKNGKHKKKGDSTVALTQSEARAGSESDASGEQVVSAGLLLMLSPIYRKCICTVHMTK